MDLLLIGTSRVQADGHCMYRSVEDQLRATARAAKAKAAAGVEGRSVNVGEHGDGDEGEGEGEEEEEVPDYQELRELAAEHLRSHRGEFAPYLVPEDEGEDPEAYFERYCDAVETTATWGGHVELQALSGALGRRITVFAVGMQPQVLGEGKGADEGLTLCFLRHAYGLGEHYNSTKKLLFAPEEVVAEVAAGGDDK
jgi:OTU domain-containing protein 6